MILVLATILLVTATFAVSRRPRNHEHAKVDATKGEWVLASGMGIGVLSLFALVVWSRMGEVSMLELWLLGGVTAVGWLCGLARRYVYGRWS
ncbi:MAG: hypothetical protein KKG14_10235 [Alphaproteobacteria bacterium]|nr:hypothetical protein [Alphaproteobacteria bacterium]MBU2272221.1 hypothetical protein [Alphaproteobacteria bacterium]MBU2419067.1 hypothetical protein [Alphaproteobacteria bacterium]